MNYLFSILAGLQGRQELPNRPQIDETDLITQRIDRKWMEAVYFTKLFATYEVENPTCSRVGEDETAKIVTMFTRYMERNANRNQLADALDKVNERTLSQKVLSRH